MVEIAQLRQHLRLFQEKNTSVPAVFITRKRGDIHSSNVYVKMEGTVYIVIGIMRLTAKAMRCVGEIIQCENLHLTLQVCCVKTCPKCSSAVLQHSAL